MKRPEKKSESLEVRLPYTQKQAFMAACRERGVTASDTVRQLIAETLEAEAHGSKQPRTWKTMIKENPLKAAASALAVLMSGGVFAAGTSLADEKLFDKLDMNGDGALSDWEFSVGGAPDDAEATIFDLLDTDDDRKLARDEFREEGRVVLRGEETIEMEGETRRRVTVTYVTFDLVTEEGGSASGISEMNEPIDLYASDTEVRRLQNEMVERAEASGGHDHPAKPRG